MLLAERASVKIKKLITETSMSRFGQSQPVQPPSSTNPRGTFAAGPRNNDKKKGTAVITLDELDRIRRQVIETKEDSYEMQRTMQRAKL